jgi:hypothetical protein
MDLDGRSRGPLARPDCRGVAISPLIEEIAQVEK